MDKAESILQSGMTLIMVFLIAIVLVAAFFIRRQIKAAQRGDEYIRWGIAQEKKRRFPDAIMCYMTAEEMYRKHGDEAGRARAFYLAGTLEAKRGAPDEAMKYYRKAETPARKAAPTEDLGFLLMSMGEAEEELGHTEKAKKYFAEAAAVYEKGGDHEGLLYAQEKLQIETEEE
ncbi:MAG: hypothetical protein LBS91_05460 [Clostridiales Family XIII bacterium]|jgi:tetratricopeptide (TPR) repeat protein|nr:hypothetical protein [Clostridiales Family XIII bacterium]